MAALPVLIDYSTTARGYPVITLFALLIVALAAYVKDHRNLSAWGILVLFSSLGMYTNPTMIYPIGMTFTWLFLSKLINDVNQEYGSKYYLYLGGSVALILVLSGVFYSPIIYSSGLNSIVGNDVIEALSWSEFTQSVLPRIRNTWGEWNRDLPRIFSIIALAGLGAALLIEHCVKDALAENRLQMVDTRYSYGHVTVRVRMRDRYPTAAARTFQQFLESTAEPPNS